MKFGFPKYMSEKTQGIPNYRLRGYHKPLVHYSYISFAAFLILLVAFIIFLIVALSLPIIKTVYLLKFSALPNPNLPQTDIATTLKFGVWGVCATR
jgi:type IV secretory pathway component VirB8